MIMSEHNFARSIGLIGDLSREWTTSDLLYNGVINDDYARAQPGTI